MHSLYPLFRPLLFAVDPERAHRIVLTALDAAAKAGLAQLATPRLSAAPVAAMGLAFPNRVGLAAGLDKNGAHLAGLATLGFGFLEAGTVTPRAQPGNPRPRLFRLTEDRAVINRMGFNNEGQPAAFERLQRRRRMHGVVGVNVGANKDSADRIADYVAGVRAMDAVADYLTINISSPNTPGLRGLQDEGALDDLLAAVAEVRSRKPIFLKVAPDFDEADPQRIVKAAVDHGIDGLIVANTTVSRPPLKSRHAGEAGGLSGAPLKALALDALRKFRSASGGAIPLIGVGGIADADDAWERIRAGASLVQLYSAMVFEGPGIAKRIARGLAERLAREGFANIAEAVGTERR